MADTIPALKTTLYDDPLEGETIIAEGIPYEDYLKQFEGNNRTEWLMGKVILKEMNNPHHQDLLAFLISLFRLFLGFKPLGKVFPAGVSMYVGEDKPAREPDIVIVLNEHLERIKATYLHGAADLCLEIVSPESTHRDRGKKLGEYEAAGVSEYWLLDPLRREMPVYTLAEDGRYRRIEPDSDGKIASKILPGFALHPDMLWRDDLPNGTELLALVQAML